MNVLENNDLRTLFDRYGLNYSVKPDHGHDEVATLDLNCIGADDIKLEFHEDHAVIEFWVDYGIEYVPHCRQTDYWLKLKVPTWMAEHIAYVTTRHLKEES